MYNHEKYTKIARATYDAWVDDVIHVQWDGNARNERYNSYPTIEARQDKKPKFNFQHDSVYIL